MTSRSRKRARSVITSSVIPSASRPAPRRRPCWRTAARRSRAARRACGLPGQHATTPPTAAASDEQRGDAAGSAEAPTRRSGAADRATVPSSRPGRPAPARSMFLTCCSPANSSGEVELAVEVVVGRARDHHPARLGELLQPGGDVHPVAVEVAVGLADHVAEVDADPEADALGLGHRRLALGHALLDRDRAARPRRRRSRTRPSAPSPMSLTIRPWCSAMSGSMSSLRCALRRARVPSSSRSIRRE